VHKTDLQNYCFLLQLCQGFLASARDDAMASLLQMAQMTDVGENYITSRTSLKLAQHFNHQSRAQATEMHSWRIRVFQQRVNNSDDD